MNEASNEQRSFIGKAIQHLKDFIKGIKRLLRIYGSRDKTVRAAVETPLEQLEFIAQRFEIALKEAAKNKKPATDEGGVKTSLKTIPTIEQIHKNIDFVAQMKPVTVLSGNEFQKSDEDLITQVEKYFVSLGGKVSNYYGEIELRRKGIKSSIGHGIGRNKAVAFKAVPEVLKKGKIIDYQKNWKNRGYDTVVFAAPVLIAGQEYFMGSVVIAEASKNDYYLHEVLLQKKEDEALFKTGTANGGTSGKAASPIIILLEKPNEVKQNNTEKYSYSAHKGKGYDGKSMSVNARDAYENGEMPISKWTKKLIIEAIEEYAFENDIELADLYKLNISELSHYFLEYSSWHHTGALYKPTAFYKLNSEAVKSFDKYKVEEIISARKKTEKNNKQLLEEERNQEALKMAKDTHKKLSIIFANDNHNIKQFTTFTKRFISGNVDIEKEYEQAIKQLAEKEMQSISQWKKLPANHWRHASVNEFEANPIKYFENKYLSNTNSNSKEIQLLKRYFADVLENTIDINIKTQNKKTEQKDIKALENVDGMSLTDYNNRGWAYGLLNTEDIKLLHQRIAEKMNSNVNGLTRKLSDGTFVFEVNNKIIFVRGTFDNPIIEHIVLFNAENESELEIIIDTLGGIPYGNNTIDGLRGWLEITQVVLGEEYIAQYSRNDHYASSEQEKRTIKRASLPDGFASFGYTGESNKRRRSDHDDTGEISGSKFSRQVINSTWDDIRTKMSENGVHEDVIDEIDRYIRRLRDINVSRQEEVTGGLIPKYKAVLKIAREYTKGSDVDPHELANTISEMMWAAHDGNLDTKQFVSTVRLFAEDILRTGRKINDDMYRDYADFRNMTRSETVYVDESVYNQYVEEYGSVKNLNSATQGKIKIKPREAGDVKGRSLDDFYSELKDVFPALFREDADEYHQLYEILRAWEEIQPTTEYYSEMLGIKTEADLHHQALLMAEDMLSEVLRIKDTVKKIADKYENKAAFQKEYYKEYYRTIAEKGRRKRRENDEKDVLLKRITRNTKRLSDMLINQTDKRHIPENLKGEGGLLTVGAGHELFHWLKRTDTDSASYLQNLVIQMMKNDNDINFEEIYNQRATEYQELTEDEILEEIAAQYFGVVFSSEENIRKAVNEANDAEKSILKKIIGRLKQFIAHIKATLREYAVKDKTVEAALNAEIKDLEELARKFDAALAESGKNKKPATDEVGVKYSKTSDNDSIKLQIRFNLKQISELDIAASINFTDISKKELLEKAISEFKQFGYAVERQNFGRIIIGPNEIRDGTNYINTSGEKAALLCVPKVLKKGIVIGEHQQHKNRLHDTITIAAPVEINGETVCVAVAVKRTSKNKYHAHRVLTIKGEKFVIKETKNDTKPTTPGMTAKNDGEGPSIGSVSENNITQLPVEVKDKYSRQLNNTADNIEQLKAENESFSEYIDEVVQELQSKLKNKKQPDVVKIFDRKELYKIAAKYNTYYEPNKNGGFSKKQYSNAEIADIIENVLSEVSQGKTNVQDAVTRLTAIQENVLQNGYEIEYEPGAKEFRKELRNKPIYLTARDYNQLYILVNLKRIEAGVSKAGKNNPRNTFRPASENGISKVVEAESPETPFARFPSLDYQTSFLLSTHC